MTPTHRRVTAIVAACAMFVAGLPALPSAQSGAQNSAASNAPPAKNASDKSVDGGWPRALTTGAGGEVLVYQPQVSSWDGQKQMVAYAAVSYRSAASAKPTLGTVKLEADTAVAIDERLVRFERIRVTETNFGTLDRQQVKDISDTLSGGIPDPNRVIALDRVLASIDRSTIIPRNVDGVKADPPTIFFSTTPAVLVNFDGDPIWSPIKDNDLKFAVNTNWDVFEYTPAKTYYLRWDKVWLKAPDAVKGPWTPAGQLPASFSKLPPDDDWKDVKASLLGAAPPKAGLPKIFTTTTPAELLLLSGAPVYSPIAGAGSLQWVSNSESDVFRMGKAGTVFYLVAGRWFSAPDFGGPWTFATQGLPPEFSKISLEHPRSRVLASVPGTQQAAEAVLIAQIPQSARVSRQATKAPDVAFQGDPQFAPIEKTTVSRAVNTDKDIIKVGEQYYMCYDGVWFMASSPNGPWQVASSVPNQIYEIPVSSPSYHVTYVTVEESHDDEWVTFAAAAGYTGMMIAWGCAVWGTGYYYPPYVGYGGMYPYYRPFYPTYGYAAHYNPWNGTYGRGMAVYGPYGGAGVGARYNPRTGTYARGAAAYGPYGARAAGQAYNPRTGAYARTNQGSNVYGSWGSTSVQRGDDWARTSRVTNSRTGTTTRVTQGSGGGAAVSRNTPGPGGSTIARTGSGDVYAGHDGNVYRNQGGSWQKYDGGSWGSVERPATSGTGAQRAQATGASAGTARSGYSSPTMDQLNRDSAARATGTTRTSDYGAARSSGGASRGYSGGASYRPSGGGARGGGGRRR